MIGQTHMKHSRDIIVHAGNTVFSERVTRAMLYIACGIWLAYRIATTSFFDRFLIESSFITLRFVAHRILPLIAVCELGRIWRGEYGRRDVAALLMLAAMGAGLVRNGFDGFLYDALIVFALRGEDFDRLSYFCVIVVLACLVIVVLSSVAGIIPDIIIEQHGGERVRHCLGFRYCLFPAQYLFTVTCTLCLLRDRNMGWAELVALGTVNVGCYLLTDSRLSFALAMLALGVVVLRKAILQSNATWTRVAHALRWAFVVLSVLSVGVVCAYVWQVHIGASWLDGIDTALGRRISRAYRGVYELGIRPLGQHVTWVGNGLDAYGNRATGTYNYVDNLFFHSLIQLGVVYTIGLVALYTQAAFQAERTGRQMLVLMLAVLAAHCLLDDLALALHFNTLLFVVSSSLTGPNDTR